MDEGPRILLLEENPESRLQAVEALQQAFPASQVTSAATAADFAALLDGPPFDLVVTAQSLSGTSGLEVLRAVKARWPACVTILCADTDAEEVAPEVLEAGADEYVPRSPRRFARLATAARLALARARQHRALHESEQRYHLLFRHSPVGIFYYDRSLRVVDCNDRFVAILRSSRDRLVGLDIQRLRDTRVLAAIRQALDGEEGYYEGEYRPTTSTALIHVALRTAPIFDAQGQVSGGVGIVEDVTDYWRAQSAVQRRTEQQEALRQVALDLTAELDLDALLHSIVARAVELVGGQSGGFYLYRPEEDVLEWAVSIVTSGASLPVAPGTRLRRGEGLGGKVWETGQPLLVQDYQSWAGRAEQYNGLPIAAVVGVPVRWGEEFLGVLEVLADLPHTFSSEDVEVLSLFAAQAAVGIENARLFAATQRRAEELAVLHRAVMAVSSRLEPEAVLTALAEQVGKALQVTSAYICGWDEPSQRLTVLAQWAGPEALPTEMPSEVGVVMDLQPFPALVRALRERRPLVVHASDPDLDPGDRWESQEYGWKSYLVVPLVIGERVTGAVELWETRRERQFTEAEVRLCQSLATEAAVAIEHSRLFRAEQEQRALAEALAEAAAVISSTLEQDLVLDRILEQVERVVTGDSSNVMLLEGDLARPARWRGHGARWQAETGVELTFSLAETPILRRMAETGEPAVIPDTAADPNWVKVTGEEWLRSYVGAPIRIAGETVGFLTVHSTQAGRFGPADAHRLSVFANHAAVAIRNAQLYNRLRLYTEHLEEQVQERTAHIQAQYAQLEAILRSTSDGIVVVSSQGEVLQTNPVAHAWLTQALSPEDAARLRETVAELARRAWERPEAVLELGGLDLEMTASPVVEGETTGTMSVIALHDVSRLKSLDRMKSRFVSNVSHELRTPITTLKLYLTLLRKSPPERWPQYLDVLEKEVERQAQLVEDILQISRVDAGRLELRLQPMSLNHLADTMVERHRVMAQSRGVTLECRLSPEEPAVLADVEQMALALNNLVINAIYHTLRDGRVTVSAGKVEAEERLWGVLEVADTGIGIPADELPHIYERFFRGEQSRQMQLPGTGLGLAIVKEIVELHRGRVTVKSVPGQGSTFTIWLPLAERASL